MTVNDASARTQLYTKSNCAVIGPIAPIVSVSPRQVVPGSTVNVTVRAEFLKFKAGQAKVDFVRESVQKKGRLRLERTSRA